MDRRSVLALGGIAAMVPANAVGAATPPDVQLAKFRYKAGGRAIWTSWAQELKQRQAEVVATMRDEGVRTEACFMSPAGDFVYYFLAARDLAHAQAMFTRSRHPLDDMHKKNKQASLEFVESMTPLFAFQSD